jgi:hypothetical protein
MLETPFNVRTVVVANQTINPGQTLTLTNVATAPSGITEAFVYTLRSGPSNAVLGASSGVLTWRPTVRQGDTTNTIVLQAEVSTDSSLRATNSFQVFVQSVVRPEWRLV